jgi:L-threonylcarbamoyladenylate synthase
MQSITLKEKNSSEVIKQCASILNDRNGVALLPTETVYGLICRYDNQIARQRIYDLKQRDPQKPFQIFINSLEQLNAYSLKENKMFDILFKAFCPGPITLIVETEDSKTLGIRVPDHKLIQALLAELDTPLAATSANLSGSPLARSPQQALSELNGTPDIIVDAGVLAEEAKASTVVDITGDTFKILREGDISELAINRLLQNKKN